MNKLEEVKKQIEEAYEGMSGLENSLLLSKSEAQLVIAKNRLHEINEFKRVHSSEMPSLLNFVRAKIEGMVNKKEYFVEISISDLISQFSNGISERHSIKLIKRLFHTLISKGYDVEILGFDKIKKYDILNFNLDKCKYLHIHWWQDDPK